MAGQEPQLFPCEVCGTEGIAYRTDPAPLDLPSLVRDYKEAADRLAEAVRSVPTGWRRVYRDDQDGDTEPGADPDTDRAVLVFLNGHVGINDMKGRMGGGYGVRLGWFDHDKNCWRAGGHYERFVTHWMELPQPPEIKP